jgi:hypothetical protein
MKNEALARVLWLSAAMGLGLARRIPSGLRIPVQPGGRLAEDLVVDGLTLAKRGSPTVLGENQILTVRTFRLRTSAGEPDGNGGVVFTVQ